MRPEEVGAIALGWVFKHYRYGYEWVVDAVLLNWPAANGA